MNVAKVASERGVTEVLHYTSERGVMGSIMKSALLSREQLEKEGDVDYVFEGVWIRKDPAWVDHISLSVSRINLDLFGRSKKRFPDFWWAVMSFSVDILDHPGVWFTTTNNIYPVCERGQGTKGFEAMFGSPIDWGRHGASEVRPTDQPDNWPTHRAAEVLCPQRIPLDLLNTIYVPGAQHRRLVRAWAESYGVPEPPVEVSVEPFS